MHRQLPVLVAAALVAVSGLGAGCSSTSDVAGGPAGSATTAVPSAFPPCPVEPIPVVVSVDQWGDVVRQLGGACTEVTTIVTGTASDPHEYEPTPADSARFTGARLVVVNGLDYDPWADKAVDTLSAKPAVVDAGAVAGLEPGANPHLWYGPEHVDRVAGAVTAELERLSPGAAPYFGQRASDWVAAMAPYRDEVARVRGLAAGRSYAATEPVFEEMARAVGLQDVTPEGYRNAAANESEPAPGDLNEFQQVLRDGRATVLVFNSQTAGSIPDQLRDTAQGAAVPVVEVTETMPPGTDSFVSWQVAQLRALADALA